MIKWFQDRLFFNRKMVASNEMLSRSLDMAQAEIETLKQWNQELRERSNRFEEMILKRAGLIVNGAESANAPMGPSIPVVETWRTAKRKLENMHKAPESTTDKLSEEQQKYWEEKMKKQEEEVQSS